MNRVVVVTAGSRGIGAAICRRAAEHGFAVAINYRSSEQAAVKLAEDIAKAGGKAAVFQADVTREEEICALFQAVKDTLGPVTHLVNNAGGGKVITGPTGCAIRDTTAEMYRRMFDLNVGSTILCTREAIRQMESFKETTDRAIVNISSDRGRSGGFPNGVLYGAAKGAIDNLTRGLARELAPSGIRVNALRPATIDTDSHKGTSKEAMARMKQMIPLGRLGDAGEVANVALFLLSEEASFVTGSLVDITGGR